MRLCVDGSRRGRRGAKTAEEKLFAAQPRLIRPFADGRAWQDWGAFGPGMTSLRSLPLRALCVNPFPSLAGAN